MFTAKESSLILIIYFFSYSSFVFPFLFVLLLLLFITNCSFFPHSLAIPFNCFPHTQTHQVIQQFHFYLLKTAFLEPSILSWSDVFVLLICYAAETSGLPFTTMRAFTGLIPLLKSPFPGTPGSTFFGLNFCFGGSIFLGFLRNDVWEANVYIFAYLKISSSLTLY